MKRVLTIILSIGLSAYAYAEDLNINTYSPSQSGYYNFIRFQPHKMPPSCAKDTLILNENKQIAICDGSGEEGFSTPALTFNVLTKDIYKTDPTKGHLGIGITSPEFLLTLDYDGAIYAGGTLGAGDPIPDLPLDANLIWNPRKGAFLAKYGLINDSLLPIGLYSTTLNQSYVEGKGSTGLGESNVRGDYSFSAGNQCNSTGNYTTCIGSMNSVSGDNSRAIGRNLSVSADDATAIGYAMVSQTVTNPMAILLHNDVYIDGSATPPGSPVLDVNGNIRTGYGVVASQGAYGASSEEKLRIIRGTVNSNGTIKEGIDFTVNYLSAGTYEIIYSAGKLTGSYPSVIATPITTSSIEPRIPNIIAMDNNHFVIQWLAHDIVGLPETDTEFNFIVMGESL